MVQTLRRLVIGASVPLVVLVLVGVLAPRAEDRRDLALRDLKVFSESLALVSRHYVEEVDFRQLERGAYQGLAESLDPWSSYYDPSHVKPLLARDRSADVGLLLLKRPQEYVHVAAVVPGSPADLGSVKREYVETIDGLETKDLTLFEAQAMLSGPPGTTVKLGFFRGSDDEEGKVVTLERTSLAALRVVATRNGPSRAVLRVTDCAAGIAPLVASELAKLKADGVEKLVLDLRTNVGGTPEDAAALASLFVGPGPVAQRATRTGKTPIDASGEKAWNGGLVVLTSRSTIGEAELVADALRARRGTALVGQPTFGKSTQQDLVLLADGTGLWMSVAQYRHADGSELPPKGIEPDEKVALHAGAEAAEAEIAAIVSDDTDEDAAETEDDEAVPAAATGATGATAPSPAPPKATETKTDKQPEKDLQLERALEILDGSPVKKAT